MWRLRRGMDRRFQSGHPWVYSNELQESPKGIEPGAIVQLQNAGGKFLAWGHGNPQSLIAFRCLSRELERSDLASAQSIVNLLVDAQKLRRFAGYIDVSHRLLFGEADGIPGLIIDFYVLSRGLGQVFVVQAHTAGADRICANILEILQLYVESGATSEEWDQTAVVLRNDLSVRVLEGLTKDEPRLLKDFQKTGDATHEKKPDIQNLEIQIPSAFSGAFGGARGGKSLSFRVDLFTGQKTGFFLDQFSNIQLACLLMTQKYHANLRILDLCCYVGQWGAQLSHAFQERMQNQNQTASISVVAVDSSKKALEFARSNIEAQGISCTPTQMDVLEAIKIFDPESFDLVIVDPPALIKSRKDIPVGKHAYLQLVTQAMRLTKKGGGIICCSCSSLLDEGTFSEVLAKAAQRSLSSFQWIGRGSLAADHPTKAEFPEGRYLKCWMGYRSES